METATACLNYLQRMKHASIKEFGKLILRLDKYSEYYPPAKMCLANYTCNFWHVHIQNCQGLLIEKELQLVREFLMCPEKTAYFEYVTYTGVDYEAERACYSPGDLPIHPRRVHVPRPPIAGNQDRAS